MWHFFVQVKILHAGWLRDGTWPTNTTPLEDSAPNGKALPTAHTN